jgi:hypothetical protein
MRVLETAEETTQQDRGGRQPQVRNLRSAVSETTAKVKRLRTQLEDVEERTAAISRNSFDGLFQLLNLGRRVTRAKAERELREVYSGRGCAIAGVSAST